MQFLDIINEILAPNKHNINFGSLNMTVQRMPNILQYVLQYALAVSYRIAIRLQPQYPPLYICLPGIFTHRIQKVISTFSYRAVSEGFILAYIITFAPGLEKKVPDGSVVKISIS